MATIVQKYGGSSVADVAKIGAVADKVVRARDAGYDVVVVVSAMGKTTDELLALAHRIDENPPRRELDMLLSTGERISMALLSMAIQARGRDAISFTGSQSGIITNDRHYDARIIDVRPHRVEDELARGRVVIIAGYQGMSYKREITTLGRGGSDTTALAMAAALGAEYAEIYSDVDGVYSADPRKVKGAEHLPEISYDEMEAMASAGAKVLHHKAVAFARDAGITIRARSTFSDARETRVFAEGAMRGAVVPIPEVAYVRMPAGKDGGRQVLQALGAIEAQGLGLSDGTLGFHLAIHELPDWSKLRGELEARDAVVHDDLGAVSFIRDGAARDLAKFLESLGCVPKKLHTHGLGITALIGRDEVERCTQRVHEAFLGQDAHAIGEP